MTHARSGLVGYAAGVVLPVAVTYGVTWLNIPPFVFAHVVVPPVLGGAVHPLYLLAGAVIPTLIAAAAFRLA